VEILHLQVSEGCLRVGRAMTEPCKLFAAAGVDPGAHHRAPSVTVWPKLLPRPWWDSISSFTMTPPFLVKGWKWVFPHQMRLTRRKLSF